MNSSIYKYNILFLGILLNNITVHNIFFILREEKKKIEEQSKPKTETALPGWGSWAGPNIRKRTFKKRTNAGFFRTPAKPPRKDFNREKVIINENANDAIKSHMVRFLFRNFAVIIFCPIIYMKL